MAHSNSIVIAAIDREYFAIIFAKRDRCFLWPPSLKAKVVPIWRRPIYSRVNDEGSRSHTRFAEWHTGTAVAVISCLKINQSFSP